MGSYTVYEYNESRAVPLRSLTIPLDRFTRWDDIMDNQTQEIFFEHYSHPLAFHEACWCLLQEA